MLYFQLRKPKVPSMARSIKLAVQENRKLWYKAAGAYSALVLMCPSYYGRKPPEMLGKVHSIDPDPGVCTIPYTTLAIVFYIIAEVLHNRSIQ
jgi:hypothetical protein